MPKKKPDVVAEKKRTRRFSIISNKIFRQLHALMSELRATGGREKVVSKNLEAVLAATTLQLGENDLIFSSAKIFPSAYLSRPGPRTMIADKKDASYLVAAAGAALGIHGRGAVFAFSSSDASSAAPSAQWQDALALAVKHRLPIVFVLCATPGHDNERQAATIQSLATTIGLIAIPVDIADAVAIYRVTFESLARARRGTGPTLIVCTQYALKDGTSAPKQRHEDPLKRLEAYLTTKGIALR